MTATMPDFNTLSEGEQRLVAERLIRIQDSGWKPFWCPDSTCNGDPHVLLEMDPENGPTEVYAAASATQGPNGEPLGELVEGLGRQVLDPKWAHNHARVDQRLPAWKDPWTLFIMSGRGSGKTKIGTEFVTLCARKGLDGAILGRRGTELVNTHVKRLLAEAHPEFMPEYHASKDTLTWPNGAVTYLFSAEKPENIRSVNLSYSWVDEAAFMDDIEAAWDNIELASRVFSEGNPIHHLITSTPTATKWVMEMEDDPDVIVRRVSTFANAKNLDPGYLAKLVKKYQGTRKGRQELAGEVLRDVEGALWNDEMFKYLALNADPNGAVRFQELLEGLDDRVLAVDPAGSKGKRSDATGIIGVGAHHLDDDGDRLAASRLFVLGDATIKGSPSEWAERTFKAARLWRVNRIIAEKNFGGDMVKQVLQDYAKLHPAIAKDENGEDYRIEVVHAQKSKEVRAEGTVGKYEQGLVTHVTSPTAYGDLSELESEMTTWVPKSRGGKMASPNRVDATVWAVRAVETNVRYESQMASQADIRAKMKRR